jgi:hypothetical protein
VTRFRVIKSNRPSGMYWIKSRSGIDMQVRADEIILAEPVNGDPVTILYFGSYDRDHQVVIAQRIDTLYDRPVVLVGGDNEN